MLPHAQKKRAMISCRNIWHENRHRIPECRRIPECVDTKTSYILFEREEASAVLVILYLNQYTLDRKLKFHDTIRTDLDFLSII